MKSAGGRGKEAVRRLRERSCGKQQVCRPGYRCRPSSVSRSFDPPPHRSCPDAGDGLALNNRGGGGGGGGPLKL